MALKLSVGSQMETGEWKSGGLWLKKDKEKNEVPSNLQVIAPEDLVKVSMSRQMDQAIIVGMQKLHLYGMDIPS